MLAFRRAASFLIDLFIITIVALFLMFFSIIGVYEWNIEEEIFLFLFFVSYFFLLEGGYGTTVGKRIFKLKVINIDGSKIGYYRSLQRAFIFFLLPVLAGLIYEWINFYTDDRGNTLIGKFSEIEFGVRFSIVVLIFYNYGSCMHDMYSKTVVLGVGNELNIPEYKKNITAIFIILSLLISVPVSSSYQAFQEKFQRTLSSSEVINNEESIKFSGPESLIIDPYKNIPNSSVYLDFSNRFTVYAPVLCADLFPASELTFEKSPFLLPRWLIDGGLGDKPCIHYNASVSNRGFLSSDFHRILSQEIIQNTEGYDGVFLMELFIKRETTFFRFILSRKNIFFKSDQGIVILEPDGSYSLSFDFII